MFIITVNIFNVFIYLEISTVFVFSISTYEDTRVNEFVLATPETNPSASVLGVPEIPTTRIPLSGVPLESITFKDTIFD